MTAETIEWQWDDHVLECCAAVGPLSLALTKLHVAWQSSLYEPQAVCRWRLVCEQLEIDTVLGIFGATAVEAAQYQAFVVVQQKLADLSRLLHRSGPFPCHRCRDRSGDEGDRA